MSGRIVVYYDLMTENELNSVLPALGRRGGARLEKKKQVYEKIKDLVDVFIGI